MAPAFPQVDRIELVASPLEMVICQLRFPLVLGLAGNQPPELFHKRLSDKYPIATRRQTTSVEISEAGQRVSASALWAFEDKDAAWTVSLAPTFVSLETKKYVRFDDFVERFLEVVRIARELYEIKIRDRLGLRYVDHFSKTIQPSFPDNWPALLRPELLPLRSMTSVGEAQHASFESRFAGADFILAVRCVYTAKGFPGATQDELVLDFDCYSETRDDLEGLEAALRSYRDHTYRAFRWAIGDLIDQFESKRGGAT